MALSPQLLQQFIISKEEFKVSVCAQVDQLFENFLKKIKLEHGNPGDSTRNAPPILAFNAPASTPNLHLNQHPPLIKHTIDSLIASASNPPVVTSPYFSHNAPPPPKTIPTKVIESPINLTVKQEDDGVDAPQKNVDVNADEEISVNDGLKHECLTDCECSDCEDFDAPINAQSMLQVEMNVRMPVGKQLKRRKVSDDDEDDLQEENHNNSPPNGQNLYPCRFAGCGKAFKVGYSRARHERVHTNARPFVCRYPNCTGYDAKQEAHMIRHIRSTHFGLPRLLKTQLERGIVDNRDPKDFIQVLHHLL